ncbi:MAG: flagellar basal body L-ring protein FlgH, partial [Phaeobacter gallaeciensis]
MKHTAFTSKAALAGLIILGACGRADHLGKPPSFSPANESSEHVAMLWQGLPQDSQPRRAVDSASLWSGSQQSLLGDRRAIKKGDIMTVVIEIDETAEIKNDTARSRSGSESMALPQLLGLPQRLDRHLPDGASASNAVELGSSSSA